MKPATYGKIAISSFHTNYTLEAWMLCLRGNAYLNDLACRILGLLRMYVFVHDKNIEII